MKEALAKKYVKALFQACSLEEFEKYSRSLIELSKAYGVEKFLDIISSPELSRQKKLDFVMSLIEGTDTRLTNFFKLLSENDRFMLIPQIAAEMKEQLASAKKEYEGVLVSGQPVSGELFKELQQKFSQKVGANVVLTQKQEEFEGIRIYVDSLGAEIGFSKDRFEADMSDHILKAI